MAADTELSFPVIFLARDGYVEVRMSSGELFTTGVKALRKGLYRDATLIDASGALYAVRSAERVAYVPPFWGFRLTYSRRVRLKLQLVHQGNLELSQIKARVISAVKRHPHPWDSVVDRSLESFLEELAGAPSRERIAELLAA